MMLICRGRRSGKFDVCRTRRAEVEHSSVAAHLLSQIPLLIGQEVEHRNLEIARRKADDHWMALHAQHAFDLAYRLSVSPVDALHAPGLDMFSNLMDLWSHDKDPDSVADGDVAGLVCARTVPSTTFIGHARKRSGARIVRRTFWRYCGWSRARSRAASREKTRR